MATDPSASGAGRWDLDLFDRDLALRLVARDHEPVSGIDSKALVDELIELLEQRELLSRSNLSDDPVHRRPSGARKAWRLIESDAVWRVQRVGASVELLVAQAPGEVTLLSPPGGPHGPRDGEGLLSDYVSLSRDEPYACADRALSYALHRINGPGFDIGMRQDLEFDEDFRRRPEQALFEVGFSAELTAGRRYLARVLHVYDLECDFRGRPLPRRDLIADARLTALWAPSKGGASSVRPTVLVLMSIDDQPTQRLIPHLKRIAEDEGYALTPIFALTQWGKQDLAGDELARRLEEAWSGAPGPVAGLIVHYGATFSSHPSEYQAALTAFQRGHRAVPLATEALLGERGGELHGVAFDQPAALDFLCEQLGF